MYILIHRIYISNTVTNLDLIAYAAYEEDDDNEKRQSLNVMAMRYFYESQNLYTPIFYNHDGHNFCIKIGSQIMATIVIEKLCPMGAMISVVTKIEADPRFTDNYMFRTKQIALNTQIESYADIVYRYRAIKIKQKLAEIKETSQKNADVLSDDNKTLNKMLDKTTELNAKSKSALRTSKRTTSCSII